jgi:hypothetical protein
MALNPKIWYPVAVAATVINLIGVGWYAMSPIHATAHAVLALGFGLWAQRLGRSKTGSEQLQVDAAATEQLQQGFEALQGEVIRLRQELSETQERVDFVERVLAQGKEARRVGPER